MRRFMFSHKGKLVRDAVPEGVVAQGGTLKWHELTDDAYKQALLDKLCEESREVSEAHTRADILAEIADVHDVLVALCEHMEISPDDIATAQSKKRHERGGYSRRVFVEHMTIPEQSWLCTYCAERPDEYPEISADESTHDHAHS